MHAAASISDNITLPALLHQGTPRRAAPRRYSLIRTSRPRLHPQSGEGGKSKAWLALCLHTRALPAPLLLHACTLLRLVCAVCAVCAPRRRQQHLPAAPPSSSSSSPRSPQEKACKPALIVRCGFGRRASVCSGSHYLPSHTSETHPAGPDLLQERETSSEEDNFSFISPLHIYADTIHPSHRRP
jgi:hypothetical protein